MMRFLSFIFVLVFTQQTFAATLVVLGDSLSAGYQMQAEQSWPSLLDTELEKYGHDVTIINASISGDTTGNGIARLPLLLEQHQPDFVLIELGANDGLRGFPPTTIRNNLGEMITQIEQAGAYPLLMQIFVPPNYGKRYSDQFAKVYQDISSQLEIPLLPFFLEHIILKQEWMMDDGLHPKPDAQPWIAEFMAKEIAPHL
ncbi:multifunctional acyl-CoA thioesterase I/protease I/lysophospholipase L1 [Photobacterium sp. ZSDE20]|uniref:Multifunctional acyl-CoA thioesterase I/protease I/lysophospholipase L1 n=1 Tax=Photobacterium pectinilyticum TaxID=2906793 RepID=A0ABT1MY34_9GAMM|nr:multifunctional acyl-CoA thioesterase I/protease I/lysophospholipase L1 [Photobacterium sp. ZSDE20]MCQ1057375.1 multifunctional acyl-CoA thioesterase I/protease I/lysophospholipase L1 [Photobacterium sp. ZSDE20]MDD1821676.1 multifunctional acyl-CoA thioesterase I/protease I/lysophospholipase L1 [Photobacterium sp. ZSDE20]